MSVALATGAAALRGRPACCFSGGAASPFDLYKVVRGVRYTVSMQGNGRCAAPLTRIVTGA